MDNNDIYSNDEDRYDDSLEEYVDRRGKSELWLMAVERQKHLEELERKYVQLYKEGKEDGFSYAIRIAVEERYCEDLGVWLHELNDKQKQAIVPLMAALDDIATFKQAIGLLG